MKIIIQNIAVAQILNWHKLFVLMPMSTGLAFGSMLCFGIAVMSCHLSAFVRGAVKN